MSPPNSNGRVSTGVANVLSMPNSAPCRWATSAHAATSVIDSFGLPGDSIHTSFVAGVIARSTFVGSVVSIRSTVIPARLLTWCINRYVPP
jgi:hypothetical protein